MFEDAMDAVGKSMDAAGVAVIVIGVVVAAATSLRQLRHSTAEDAYRSLRQRVGRAILLGLEVLVAADIIRTVAVSPTLERAGSLAIIVGIRTALSFSLEVELEGRWPWQRRRESRTPTPIAAEG
jgi:uncharacterized membrane protein